MRATSSTWLALLIGAGVLACGDDRGAPAGDGGVDAARPARDAADGPGGRDGGTAFGGDASLDGVPAWDAAPGGEGAAADARAAAGDAAPGHDGAAGPGARVLFATSESHDGNLGGLAGADAICGRLARAAGLPGEFRAWLSAGGQSPAQRLPRHDGPFVRTDGVLVATGWADLTDGALRAPILTDELGRPRRTDAWTGTLPDGTAAPGVHCDDFGSADLQGTALCGATTATDARWTANVNPTCWTPLALYCVQVR